MNRKERSKWMFMGALMYAAILSLYQDIVFGTGEAYAQHVIDRWINRGITIPVAILVLLIIGFNVFAVAYEDRDEM